MNDIEHSLLCFRMANFDKKEFDVEHVCESWIDWFKIESKRKSEGWELANYGQSGTLWTMSGYFKRKKL